MNRTQIKGVLATLCAVLAVLLAVSCEKEPMPGSDGGRSAVSFVVSSTQILSRLQYKIFL